MRVAVSNLAWDADEEVHVAELMKSLGIDGLEVAPTRIWPLPLRSSHAERTDIRTRWNDRGISIVSLQALLFGRPDLVLFETAASREAILDNLRGMIDLASDLGAARLVFGSPRNRALGSLTKRDADEIALPFFRTVGDFAVDAGVVFCIEPNPAHYDCDWITTIEEGHSFVSRVAHKGIGINADSGGITLAGEDPSVVIPRANVNIAHFHISEPQLVPVGTGGVDHQAFVRALNATGYTGWASVEMRLPARDGRMKTLESSFRTAVELYSSTAPDV